LQEKIIQLQILQLGPGLQDMSGTILDLKNYKNLSRWYLEIADREAVIKGYDLYKIGSQIPKGLKILFILEPKICKVGLPSQLVD
jgi:hypothetical protein